MAESAVVRAEDALLEQGERFLGSPFREARLDLREQALTILMRPVGVESAVDAAVATEGANSHKISVAVTEALPVSAPAIGDCAFQARALRLPRYSLAVAEDCPSVYRGPLMEHNGETSCYQVRQTPDEGYIVTRDHRTPTSTNEFSVSAVDPGYHRLLPHAVDLASRRRHEWQQQLMVKDVSDQVGGQASLMRDQFIVR